MEVGQTYLINTRPVKLFWVICHSMVKLCNILVILTQVYSFIKFFRLTDWRTIFFQKVSIFSALKSPIVKNLSCLKKSEWRFLLIRCVWFRMRLTLGLWEPEKHPRLDSKSISTKIFSILWEAFASGNRLEGISSFTKRIRPPPRSVLSRLYGVLNPSEMKWLQSNLKSNFYTDTNKTWILYFS